MTGFGHAVVSKDGRELSIELKSVNHRFLDLALRMPRSLAFLEGTRRGTRSARCLRAAMLTFLPITATRGTIQKKLK